MPLAHWVPKQQTEVALSLVAGLSSTQPPAPAWAAVHHFWLSGQAHFLVVASQLVTHSFSVQVPATGQHASFAAS